MALLASFQLFQCDGCQRIAPIKNDDDWQQFDKTWHVGFFYDYCPTCRAQSTLQEKLIADNEAMLTLKNMGVKLNAEHHSH